MDYNGHIIKQVVLADAGDAKWSLSVWVYDTDTPLTVKDILWQADTTIRYTFEGSPDLSNIKVGDRLEANGAVNESNEGHLYISAVDYTYIEVTNESRPNDTEDESDSPATVTICKCREWSGISEESETECIQKAKDWIDEL